MESRTPTEEYRDDTDGAFEAQLRTVMKEAVDSKPDKQILKRLRDAEARESKLKEEAEDRKNDQELQRVEMEELKARLRAVTASLNQKQAETASMEEHVQRLKQENDSLSLQIDKAQMSLVDLGTRMRACETEKAILSSRLREYRELHQPWSVEQYVELSDDDHRFPGRPDLISLRPICDRATDLKACIEKVRVKLLKQGYNIDVHNRIEVKELRWVTGNFIRLSRPHRLIWTSTSCQVGLAFGPMHVYEGSYGWKEHSIFFEHDGKHVELFFEDEEKIYYAGTYELDHIRHRNPQGCLLGSVEGARELSDLTVSLPTSDPGSKSKPVKQALQHLVETLYIQGILRVECAVLRCVGFNRQIHDTLSTRYTESKQRKREANLQTDPRHKRPRAP